MGYQWIVEGKIGCHFPQKSGNPNYDVTQIFYNNDGVQANSTEISAVYFLTPTHAATINAMSTDAAKKEELEKYSVWKRYYGYVENKELVMDTDGYVLMKYNPGINDVSANSIGIFTTNSTSDNGRCVYILNEDGWLVGKSNATETKNIDIEKYGLTGSLRTTTFSTPFVFKAGKDYWIQYYFENCQNAADAYYNGIQGTDYKRLSLSNLYNTNPLDLSQYNYVGTVFNSTAHIADLVDSVLSLNYNDCFLSTQSIYHPTGLTKNYLYARTSSYSLYYGLLDHSSLPTDQNKPRNDELVNISAGQVFTIKTVTQNYNGVYIWQRGNQEIPEFDPGYNNVVITGSNAKNNYADFINNITPNKYCQVSAISDISYVNLNDGRAPKTDGTIYLRTEQGLTNCGSNNMQTTQIGNPIAGTVYYKAHDLDLPGSTQQYGDNSIVIYLGNNTYADFDFNKTYTITADDNTTATCQHFSAISLNDIATDVTNTVWNNIYSQVATNSTKTDITSTSTSADMKHYLEINGNEVF